MFEPLDPKALEPGKMRSNNDVVGASGSDAAFVTLTLFNQIRVTQFTEMGWRGRDRSETEAFDLKFEML